MERFFALLAPLAPKVLASVGGWLLPVANPLRPLRPSPATRAWSFVAVEDRWGCGGADGGGGGSVGGGGGPGGGGGGGGVAVLICAAGVAAGFDDGVETTSCSVLRTGLGASQSSSGSRHLSLFGPSGCSCSGCSRSKKSSSAGSGSAFKSQYSHGASRGVRKRTSSSSAIANFFLRFESPGWWPRRHTGKSMRVSRDFLKCFFGEK